MKKYKILNYVLYIALLTTVDVCTKNTNPIVFISAASVSAPPRLSVEPVCRPYGCVFVPPELAASVSAALRY